MDELDVSPRKWIQPSILSSLVTNDRPVVLLLDKGGYAIENNCLTISVSTEVSEQDYYDEDVFPNYGCICLEDYPIAKPLEPGDTFEHSGGMYVNDDNETPRAHGYFEFHVEEITVKWTVVAVSEDSCRFALEARHDDPDYYDERAKPTATTGVFELSKTPKENLWIPV